MTEYNINLNGDHLVVLIKGSSSFPKLIGDVVNQVLRAFYYNHLKEVPKALGSMKFFRKKAFLLSTFSSIQVEMELHKTKSNFGFFLNWSSQAFFNLGRKVGS